MRILTMTNLLFRVKCPNPQKRVLPLRKSSIRHQCKNFIYVLTHRYIFNGVNDLTNYLDRKSLISPFVYLTSSLPHDSKSQILSATSFTTSIRRRGSQKWRSKKNFKPENIRDESEISQISHGQGGGTGKRLLSRKLSLPDQIKSPKNLIDEYPQTVSYNAL